ncbi:MAG TPA: lipase family protein [Buttiauxella sp.]|jgi:hypothetical protein
MIHAHTTGPYVPDCSRPKAGNEKRTPNNIAKISQTQSHELKDALAERNICHGNAVIRQDNLSTKTPTSSFTTSQSSFTSYSSEETIPEELRASLADRLSTSLYFIPEPQLPDFRSHLFPASPLKTANDPQVALTPAIASDALIASQVAAKGYFKNVVFERKINVIPRTDYPDDFKGNGGLYSEGAIHMGAYFIPGQPTLKKTTSYKCGSDNNVIYLGFSGYNDHHDVKFIFKCLFGKETKEMKKAAELVDAFKKQQPNKKIVLVGHSMGGALASYCGIKHDLDVVNFNGMGLSRHLIKRLQKGKSSCHITNINTQKDWLSRLQKSALIQPGQRYKLSLFTGHGLHHRKQNEDYLISDALYDLKRRK